MHRLGMGYAKYFNLKYTRTGALFEGRYKAVPIRDEAHFIHVPYYIHCNPLDLVAPEWRQRMMKNSNKAFEFLEKYRWSSFQDYIGKKNFPSVTSRNFLGKYLGGTAQYRKHALEWIQGMNFDDIKKLSLD